MTGQVKTSTTTVDATELLRAIAAVIPCAGVDDHLPILKCVELTMAEGVLTLATTDRYTLATDTVTVAEGASSLELGSYPVPLDTVKRIKGTIGKIPRGFSHYPVTLTLTDDALSLRVDYTGDVLALPRTEGDYPRWRGTLLSEDRETPGTLTPAGVERIAFNPAFMARFAKVGERSQPMILTLSAPNRLAHVSIGDTFRGLIMPVRLSS